MGFSKHEIQYLLYGNECTVSNELEEAEQYCVYTICTMQEKQSRPDTVIKKVTQRNQDSVALYDDSLLMKQNISKEDTVRAEVNMKVCSSKSSRIIRTFQIATLLIASSSCLAEGNKLQSDHIAKAKNINESLSTTQCNPGNLDMTQSCHVEGNELEALLIGRCKFKDKCPSGYTPRCVDIDEGMVFICAPVNTKCSKGYRWKVIKDKENHSKVHITVEKCPDGYFQESSSDCFHACKSKHEDLKTIPERYTIFTKGNNTHPTYVYCNYKKGYFNREDRFLLDYDGESEHNLNFCGNVNDNNPCVEGQKPLPNGTCVLPCKKNECREDIYSFICQQTCRHQTENKSSFTDVPDLDKGSGVSTKTTKKDLEIWQLIMIVGFAVALAFVTCAGCVIRCKHKKHRSQCPQVEDGNRRSEYPSTGTDEAGTVKERNGSTVSSENASNKMKQNCSSIVFNKDAQDSKSQEEDSKLSTAEEGSFTNQTSCAFSNEQESGPSDRSHTIPKNISAYDTTTDDEKEPLLADNQNGIRDFKKVINDTNTQAEVSCLNSLMLSCGAIVHRRNVIGSAFRVGPKYVITAFHVLRDKVRDLTGSRDYNFALLEDARLTLNLNESILVPHKRDIFLKYRYHDEMYDFAVLEIKDVGLHEDIPDPLFLWKYDSSHMNVNQVILIGYGNPTKPNEKHAETCEIIGENDFLTRHMAALASLEQRTPEYKNDIPGNDKSSVEYGYRGIDNEAYIKFDCFMGKGLSGGPVIITNEGHSPRVIGIVKGGSPDFYYELSPERQACFEKQYLFEVGVKMQKIYETMRNKDLDLASELFPSG